ncbi:MAG: hypothetical protein ABJQ29_09630 [Luteolibacter sp.]
MKTIAYAVTAVLLPMSAIGQTTIETPGFYEPDFKVRRAGAENGLFVAQINNILESGSGTSGSISWNLGAGGFVQARTEVPLALEVDAQLASFTQLTDDTLVFGREITTEANVLGVISAGNLLQNTLNSVLGMSVVYNWQAQASVTGLTIVPDQLYRVDFTVTSGSGLPVGVLESAKFGITTAGVTGASGESAQALDVLGLLTLGSDSSTGDFSFLFKSTELVNIDQLDFSFAAGSTVGVNALGSTEGNQNFLTYSGFKVTQIPEPSLGILGCIGIALFAMRRRK